MKLRDQPCHCGFKYQGFHICVELKGPEPKLPPTRKRPPRTTRSRDESQSQRWSKHYAKDKDRDAAIVARYKENTIGNTKLAEEFGISRTKVQTVLRRAVENGTLDRTRDRGHTIAKGAK